MTEECGPHCGIKDKMEKHCIWCHHPDKVTHGNVEWSIQAKQWEVRK